MGSARTIALTESVQQTRGKLRVDRATRTIHGAKFIGYESKNRHGHEGVDGSEYLRSGIREACKPMYEGCQVYLDHPEGRKANTERRIRDLAGRMINPRDEDDGGYTEILCNTTDAGETLLSLAESDPESFGLSHNADGKSRVDRKRRKLVIESIDKVRSVDAVTSPATTKNLRESQEPVMTLKQVIENLKLGATATAATVKLLEDDGGMAMDAAPPAPAEAGDWRTKLAETLVHIVQDTELDAGQVKAKVTAILKLLDDEKPKEDGGDTDTGSEPEEKKESRELASFRKEKAVRTLCESLKFAPTEKQVTSLAKLEEAEQRELIASLKGKSGAASGPRSNGVQSFTESRKPGGKPPADSKNRLAWLKK